MAESRQISETNGGGQDLVFNSYIGKYRYIRTLGRGSFSIVVLVFEPEEQKYFACKIVSRKQLIEENIFTRFEQEVRIQQTLHHPNIVQIFDIIYEKDIIAVVMEHCRNGELFQYIALHGALDDSLIQLWFRQIMVAIEFIHSKDITHRDIKPENILLDEGLHPKLADFGLCHLMPKQKLLSTPCGSPFYAPPEIIASVPYDGKKSDIWSLGVVLYAMSTGSLPWTEMSQTALFVQIQNAEFTIPSDISPPIQQLLQMMLAKDPAARPSASEVLQMPWLEDDATGPISTPLRSPLSRRSRNVMSCDDAMAQLRSKQSFADPKRKVQIVRPDIPQIAARHSMKFNRPSLMDVVRKVPPRTVPKRPFQ